MTVPSRAIHVEILRRSTARFSTVKLTMNEVAPRSPFLKFDVTNS